MNQKNLLYISMIGESDVFDPNDFRGLCTSGLEKDWIFDWHATVAQRFGFRLNCVDICRGDNLPSPIGVHAAILGGTIHVIDEGRPWMLSLLGWLRAYRELRRPLLGICGGHQMISTQLSDGTLRRRPSGKLVGTFPIELTEQGKNHTLFEGLPETPRFHFSNYLHVIPARNTSDSILASHEESPAIAIDHGAYWYSCQFHPESRKESWICHYEREAPGKLAAYTEVHDGNQLIGNFLRVAAQILADS